MKHVIGLAVVVTLVGCKAQQEAEPVEYDFFDCSYPLPTEEMWTEIVERSRERRNAAAITSPTPRTLRLIVSP